MQNDGNLVIYDRYRRARWATNTFYTPPISSKAAAAIAWGEQLVDTGAYSDPNGLCLQFVEDAYNAPYPRPYGTAINAWRNLDQHYDNWTAAPIGALLFWNMGRYGHVALYLGDGQILEAWLTVGVRKISVADANHSNYLGWTYPPDTWRGR